MKKNTETLINELKSTDSIDSFLKNNTQEMLDQSLAEYLRALLSKYKIEKSAVFRNANMAESNYGYEIFRDDSKNVSRDKLIQLCFGFPLTCEEAQKVLTLGKTRTLYPRDSRDAIILFGLSNGYDLNRVNEMLFSHGKNILG